MNILIVANTYPTASETFVKRHVTTLGEDVFLAVSSFKGQTLPSQNIYEYGVHSVVEKIIKRLSCFLNILRGNPYNALVGSKKDGFEHFIKKNKVDIVLIEFGVTAGVVSNLLKSEKIPFFIYFRGYDASMALKKWHMRLGIKKSVAYATGIFAVSNFLISNLKSAGIVHSNFSVLPSGVDTSLFYSSKKTKGSILYVGRFVEKKQPLLTIKSFAEVLKSYPDARLTMIGDGPLYLEVKKLIKALNLNNYVKLLGESDHSTVMNNMIESEIFIQHSVTAKNGDSEGLPSAIQEAMASGCAIVATRHSGIPEVIIDGENGLLVDEFDMNDFIYKICVLLKEPELTRKLSANAKVSAMANLDCWKIQKVLLNKLKGVSY